MVKHHPKKKKSPEKPDPKVPDRPETPPTEPVETEDDKTHTRRQLDRLFWFRVALAVMAGVAATFIFEPIEGEDRRWASIAFLIVVFLGSIVIAKGMRLNLPSSDRKKIVTQGLGSYVFIYLFIWILSYTIVSLPRSEFGLPTPFT